MKKLRNALAAILLIVSASASAQKFYVSAGVGYGLSTSRNSGAAYTFNLANSNQSDKSQTIVPIKLGQGLSGAINFGYNLNKNMAAELGVSYLEGGKTTTKQIDDPATDYDQQTILSKGFFVEPTMVFKSETSGKIEPYAKVGLLFGSPSFTLDIVRKNGANAVNSKTIVDGGMAFGYKGNLGLNYIISGKISIFGEVALRKVGYSPKKSEITQFSENGKDELSTLSIRDINTEYLDTFQTGESGSENQPRKGVKFDTELGNVSFNIGLKYSFK